MKKITYNKASIRALMESSIWFKDFPTSKINQLILKSELREYSKSEIIHNDFKQNELIFLISGSVWICQIRKGKNLKFGVMLPSSLIGLSELLLKTNHDVPFFDFRAAEDCQALAIPTSVFVAVLENSPHQWRVMTEAVIRYHRSCTSLVLGMYLGPITDRVISAIHHYCMSTLNVAKSSETIMIDLTQEALAVIIKSSRQHVNRALNALEQENLLKVGYKKIEITNPAEFSKIANSLMPLTF